MNEFRHLGKASNQPIEQIDRIEWTGSPILIHLDCSEFTTICPVTHQPDFGELAIEYVPDRYIIETKSLKLYLWKFRQEPTFNEHVVDAIADDLYQQLEPQWLQVTGLFNPRGGISVTATAQRGQRPESNA